MPRHKSFSPALKATKAPGLELQPAPGLFPAPAVPGTLHSSPRPPKCRWLPAGWKLQCRSLGRPLRHGPEHRDRGSGSSHKHSSQAGHCSGATWWLQDLGSSPQELPNPQSPALVKPGAPQGHDLCLTPAKSTAQSAPELQEKKLFFLLAAPPAAIPAAELRGGLGAIHLGRAGDLRQRREIIQLYGGKERPGRAAAAHPARVITAEPRRPRTLQYFTSEMPE